MTVPLLPFNYLGTWGAPYHGLIKGGKISLPNATQRAYPQPGSGDTWLVKFAGVPPVSRTPEQLAADAIEGYEWRNYAIIAGNGCQLHGRSIGTPWLHKDESGQVWSVEVIHSGGDIVQLDLTEFGVIRLEYVDPVEMTLYTTIPATGITSISDLTLLDVHPAGTEAVLMASQGTAKAIIKISLSNHTATTTVLKTVDDMVIDHSTPEVETIVPPELVRTPSYMRGKYDELVEGELVPGFVEFSDTPMADIYDFAGPSQVIYSGTGNGRYMSIPYITGSEERQKTTSHEYIIWANYDAGGNLHYYSSRYKVEDYEKIEDAGNYTGGWSIYCPSSTDDPGNITGSMTGSLNVSATTKTTRSQTYTYQLCRDGVAIDEYQVTLAEYIETGTNRTVSGATPSVGTFEGVVVYDDGGGTTLTPIDINNRSADFEGESLSASLPINYGGTYYLPNGPLEYEPLASGLPDFEIVQSTNKLVHMTVLKNYEAGYLIGYHIGPDNYDEIRTDVPDLTAIFASYQPYTGEIVREQSQIVTFV